MAGLVCASAGCRDIAGIHDLDSWDAEAEEVEFEDASIGSRWHIVLEGDGAGSVSLSGPGLPGGLACPPTCAGSLGTAHDLTLTVLPGSGSYLASLTPDDGRPRLQPQQLRVSIIGETEIRVRFLRLRHNLVFVSSRAQPANLGDPLAYDQQCRALATAAGLPGDDFIALLATAGESLRERLGAARGFVRIDGLPIANHLLDDPYWHAIIVDEMARVVPPTTYVFSSLRAWSANPGYDCTGWTSRDRGALVSLGESWAGAPTALAAISGNCSDDRPVVCAMRRFTAPMAALSHPGKLVFVSRAALDPGAGLPAAHGLCEAERPPRLDSSPFRALLASSGGPAARVVDVAAMYVRPDGQQIGTGAELTRGALRTGIWQFADGDPVPANLHVMTGSQGTPESPGTPETTCRDWTARGASGGAYGTPLSTASWWGPWLTNCSDRSFHLYCVEQ